MLRILALAVALSLSFACKKDEGEKPAETDGKAVLEIQPAKLVATKDQAKPFELTAEGEIKVGDDVLGKLTADGKMMDKGGKHVATIDADGKVTFKGESETLTISASGEITKDGKSMSNIGADGMLGGPVHQEMKDQVKYEGPDSAKRAMMFAFLAAMVPQKVDADDSKASAEPAATAEPKTDEGGW